VTQQVLIVDDEPSVRTMMVRILATAEYECSVAGSVREAQDLLRRESFDLAICDLKMPGGSGMVLVDEIESEHRGMAILMVTAEDDPVVARAATEHGANAYLVKPFSRNELLIGAERALFEARRRRDDRLDSDRVRRDAQQRIEEVRSQFLEGVEAGDLADARDAQLMVRLSEVVGKRDLETGAHIRRIGESAELLAAAAGLEGLEVRRIRLAAPMHDVGKVAVPDAILLKPGALDPGEREVIQSHARAGHDILSGSESELLELAATIALTHHERFDGSGYPEGLRAAEIPLAGRIVAIADVFDALTSDRPYRGALSHEEALTIMFAGRGTHFDPELHDLFIANLRAVQAIAERLREADGR
jgi:putative two-component system response regulator